MIRRQRTFLRFLYVFAVLWRHGLVRLMELCFDRWPWLSSIPKARRWIERRRLNPPERVRRMFEELGGTFLKFGQMLALQPDIIPLEYCNALFNLLDSVSPFEFEHVERVFREELGRPATEIFDRIDQRPLATASVGQVHVAWLGGRKLAVKIQRPAVETHFAGDIRLMTATLKLIRRLHLRTHYWLIEPISEFLGWTKEELDFRKEARYMVQLRANAQENQAERVPDVLMEYTTRRTLVMEFFDGHTILAVLRAHQNGDAATLEHLRARGFDDHKVAANIINNFLGDVFRYGMFHADLHPANLMVLEDSVIGYIDFGITGLISPYSRHNLIALTLAYTQGDIDGMCDAFFKVSAIDGSSDVQGFREGLKRAAVTWYERLGRERRLNKNFTLVMLDMLQLSRRTRIWPERDVIKYIRSAIAIDGLITRFAPRFNLGRYLETACERYLKLHSRQELFTFNTLFNWGSSMTRMGYDGAFRLSRVLSRITEGDLPIRIQLDPASNEGTRRLRTIYLAVLFLGASILMVQDSSSVGLGSSLFSIEAIFMGCSAAFLVQHLFRLSKER